MAGPSREIAAAIAGEAAGCGIELVASLPDGWIAALIEEFDSDARFDHIPVNREESAIGLCSGAFFGGKGALALMGASGLMTCIYAITKINYTYMVPMTIFITMRGRIGDRAKFHVSNGLYLEPVMQSIDLPYTVIERTEPARRDPPRRGPFAHHLAPGGGRLHPRPAVRGERLMAMEMEACFAHLVERWTDEVVVTSAGNASEMWWKLTGETERVFYLEASMSLASLFAAGIAYGIPRANVWAFSGDGAFLMNPGMLMVERRLGLPNLTHFLVDNGVYGATFEVDMADGGETDYAALARSCGLRNVFRFGTLADLDAGMDEVERVNGEAFVVLDVEPLGGSLPDPPMDGPECKFRFGRHLERTYGVRIFDARV